MTTRTSVYATVNTEGDVEAHVFEIDGFGFYVDILDVDAGLWLSERLGRTTFHNGKFTATALARAQAYADRCVR